MLTVNSATDLDGLFSDPKYEDQSKDLSKNIQILARDLVATQTSETLEKVLDPVFEFSRQNENCVDGVLLTAKIVSQLPSLANSALTYFQRNNISITSKSLNDYSK